MLDLCLHGAPSSPGRAAGLAHPASRPLRGGDKGHRGHPGLGALLHLSLEFLVWASVSWTTGSLVRSSWLGGQGACSPLGCSKMRSHGWSSRSPRTQTSELKPPSQGGVGLLRGGGGRGQGAKGRRRQQHGRDSRLQLSGQVPAAKVSEVGALGPTGTSSPSLSFFPRKTRWGPLPPQRARTRSQTAQGTRPWTPSGRAPRRAAGSFSGSWRHHLWVKGCSPEGGGRWPLAAASVFSSVSQRRWEH